MAHDTAYPQWPAFKTSIKTQGTARKSETSWLIDYRRFNGQNREKSSWEVKKSGKKEKKRYQKNKLFGVPWEAI